MGNPSDGNGRRKSIGVLAGLMALALGACGSSPAPAPGGDTVVMTPSSGKTTPTSPLSPADSAHRQATAAYTGMWRQMAKADETADWRSPALAKYATGDALGVISRSLYTDHLNGVVSSGAPTVHPYVSAAEPAGTPAAVMISDCGDDSTWVKHKQDGSPLADPPGGHRSITAEVKKQADDSWKVTRFAVEGVGSC